MLSRRATFTLLGAGAASLALPLSAQAQQVSVLRPRIEEALRTVRTQKGTFVQIDTTTGYGLRGEFYISRPGKLRFEYETRPELLIADGRNVARVNTATRNITRTRLNATPLRVILNEEVDLTNGVTITRMEQTPDSLFVTLYEDGRRNQGLLTVFLDVNTYELRGWKIEENDGNITTVILQETESNVFIDPNLFEIPADNS